MKLVFVLKKSRKYEMKLHVKNLYTCLIVGGILRILFYFFSFFFWNESQKSLIIFLSAMSIGKKISINQINQNIKFQLTIILASLW